MDRSVSAELGNPMQEIERQPAELDRETTFPNKSEKSGLRSWFLLALLLPLVAMLPMLIAQAQSLFSQPRFLLFPLPIVIGVGLLIGTCRYRIARGLRAKLALSFAVFGMAVAVLGMFFLSPWAVQFASVMVIFGWALGAFAGTPWTRVFAICCLFAVALPPPGRVDILINSRIYSVIGWTCNGFLDAVSLPNLFEGSVLQVADLKIKLNEVLGGVDSLFALMAVGMVVVVSRRASLLTGVVLLVLAVPFCYCLSNVVRVLVIAIGHESNGWDLTSGAGYIVTAVFIAFGAIVSLLLSYISLKALLETIEFANRANNVTALYRLVASWPNTKDWSPEFVAESEAVAGVWGNRVVLIAIPCLVCLAFGGLSAYVSLVNARASMAKKVFTESQIAVLPAQAAFPPQFGNLRMVSFTPSTQTDANATNQYSHLWKFDDKGGQAFVMLDFPLSGWRPVWTGYQGNGWKILDVKPVDIPSEVPYPDLRVEEFEMQNQYGLFAYVWYAFFDELGIPTSQTEDVSGSRVNLFTKMRTKANTDSKAHLQVQLFLESGRELTELETQSNRKLFFEAYEILRSQSEAGLKKAK